MSKLFVVVLLAIGLYHECNGVETNSVWSSVNRVVKEFDSLYDNLAVTVEDASLRQKRTFSIIIGGTFSYVASGGIGVVVDVSQPADVIASDFRSEITLIRLINDPVINVLKRACPPQTSEIVCQQQLEAAEQEQTDKCDAFPEHVNFLKTTESVVNSEIYRRWYQEVLQVSVSAINDQEALNFVTYATEGEYKELISMMQAWFEQFTEGSFSCNLPPMK